MRKQKRLYGVQETSGVFCDTLLDDNVQNKVKAFICKLCNFVLQALIFSFSFPSNCYFIFCLLFFLSQQRVRRLVNCIAREMGCYLTELLKDGPLVASHGKYENGIHIPKVFLLSFRREGQGTTYFTRYAQDLY